MLDESREVLRAVARRADLRDPPRLRLRQRRRRRLERPRRRTRSSCSRATPTPRRASSAPAYETLTGAAPAIVITDSFGRAWRHGQVDVAIGCAGLAPLEDWRGRTDTRGRELQATWIAVADELAAAADLARTKDGALPVVLVRGADRHVSADDGPGAVALIRPESEDLFR